MIVRALGVLVALACFSAPVVRAVMRSDLAAVLALGVMLWLCVALARLDFTGED